MSKNQKTTEKSEAIQVSQTQMARVKQRLDILQKKGMVRPSEYRLSHPFERVPAKDAAVTWERDVNQK